ncbi:kynureninase [Egicoccus halophilus]|uniref:Kynureninase n=1 Tax=Egicoccus halophilus TaxID=1670830 RepID=A0A8J3AF13_9ACTN|nr:kynureninase [Egicoccus halophilus]GGI06248.1 kynureninase [Egicoccus halophilus]
MDRTVCLELDASDPLADRRGAFTLADGLVYLDGNSLGVLPRTVAARLDEVVVREWGEGLIRSWNAAGWVDLPRRVAARIAPLVGADADEVAVGDSTSVNLFKVLAAARRLRPERRVLLTDDTNFPTDRYVAEGLAALGDGLEVRAVAPDAVAAALDDEVAVLFLTHVDYRSGARTDAATLTAAAHRVGAMAVWDLAHSTGALDVDLHAWDADFAVGCSYKYLNGGPGAPAYLYVARRWHTQADTPVRGWFGHARPFDFGTTYAPADGAERFLAGTPHVLSTAALEEALAPFADVSPATLDAKARSLTDTFVTLVTERCGDEVELASPREAARRGAQVSLRHPHAYALTQALIARDVIGDHRPPDLVRFGFAPLYVRHVDVHDAVEVLADVLATRAWDRPEHHRRNTVT